MLARALVSLVAVALGLYAAWWVSALAHFIHVERVNSFDELSSIMLIWFAAAAAFLCPVLVWGFLAVLKRIEGRPHA